MSATYWPSCLGLSVLTGTGTIDCSSAWEITQKDMGKKLTHLSLDKMATVLADDNFKCIFFNKNDRIPIRISLKFVPRCPIDNKTAVF